MEKTGGFNKKETEIEENSLAFESECRIESTK